MSLCCRAQLVPRTDQLQLPGDPGRACCAGRTFGDGTVTDANVRAETRAGDDLNNGAGALVDEAMLLVKSLEELARNILCAGVRSLVAPKLMPICFAREAKARVE